MSITVTERYGLSAVSKDKADLPVNSFVKLTGDKEVDLAGSGDTVIGFVRWKDNPPGYLTIETIFSDCADVTFGGTVVAGDWVKMGTASGSTQRFVKWVQGTDAESLKFGMCIVGGAVDEVGEILF